MRGGVLYYCSVLEILEKLSCYKRLTKAAGAFDRVLDIAAILAAALIVFQMLSVSIQVIVRYFVGLSPTWVIDVSAIMLLYMTFLAAAWVLRIDGHVRMDLVVSLLKPKHQSFLNAFTSIVGTLICATVFWYSSKCTWLNYQSGYLTATFLETPKWIILGIIPVGSFLLIIQFLRRTHGYLKRLTAEEATRYMPEI